MGHHSELSPVGSNSAQSKCSAEVLEGQLVSSVPSSSAGHGCTPCLHEYYLLANDCTLRCVSLGFHTNAQAIEAATRRTQCTEVLFTNDA